MKPIGFVPWDAKKNEPVRQRKHHYITGETIKHPIRVYRTAKMAERMSPSKMTKVVFVDDK